MLLFEITPQCPSRRELWKVELAEAVQKSKGKIVGSTPWCACCWETINQIRGIFLFHTRRWRWRGEPLSETPLYSSCHRQQWQWLMSRGEQTRYGEKYVWNGVCACVCKYVQSIRSTYVNYTVKVVFSIFSILISTMTLPIVSNPQIIITRDGM